MSTLEKFCNIFFFYKIMWDNFKKYNIRKWDDL